MGGKTIKTITKIRTADFAQSLAWSLVLYSQFDNKFREIVKNLELIKKHQIESNDLKMPPGTQVLIPGGREEAISRLNWLIIQKGNQAKEILARIGDKNLEVPKNVVIGIVGLAWPGVTLGVLHKKVNMVFIATKGKKNLTKQITRASHTLMKKSLTEVGGELKRLEPWMSDWFFGNKAMKIYQAEGKKIREIQKELIALGIPHAIEKKDDEIAVLAISPAINYEYSETLWQLELL